MRRSQQVAVADRGRVRHATGCLLLDDGQFVKTGADLTSEELLAARWGLSQRRVLQER
jgi:hypothetical protein